MGCLFYIFCLNILSLIYFSIAKISTITWNHQGHLFDGVARPVVFVNAGDTIQIHCPATYNSGSKHTELSYNEMFENVWKVGENGYQNCDATSGTLLATCSDPFQVIRINLDLIPRSGEVIYLISTSTGQKESLKNLKGGNCESMNMKLVVYVQ